VRFLLILLYSLLPFFIRISCLRQVSDDTARVRMEVCGQKLYLQGDFCILFQTIDVIQN